MNVRKVALFVLFLVESVCGTEITYHRHEKVSPFLTMRERVVKRPLFYAEIQSYRLVENYLHYWMDRPLFHDSGLRGDQSYRNSFLRNVEIIKDYETGLLIPSKDTDALYRAMKLLYTDEKLRDKLAKNAREQYLEKFQFNKIVKEKFIPLYEGNRK